MKRQQIFRRVGAMLLAGALVLQPTVTAQAANTKAAKAAATTNANTATTNSTAATANNAAGAQATAAAPTYQHWTGDIYYLVGSTASSEAGAYQLGVNILDTYYKEIGTLSGFELLTAQHTNGTYSLAFRQSTISTMQSIHDQCQAWCAASMPVIVPQGTSVQDALTRTATWIADYMTYDAAATTNMALANSYQNALIGIAGGKGVCATYSTMFNTMVTYLPINPLDGTVDYTCVSPTHLDTRYISAANHGYSVVNLGGSWFMYDVTNYDNMNGTRQPQYLGVPVTLGQ